MEEQAQNFQIQKKDDYEPFTNINYKLKVA